MANLYRCGGGGETITKSTITVKTSSDNFEGLTVTLTNGSYTYTGVFANKECIFKVSYTGIYTARVNYGGNTYSSEVNVNVIPSAYETTIDEGITVTYNVDGTAYNETVAKGEDVLHPTTFTPSKSNYIFYGWGQTSQSETRLNALVAGTDDITLYAIFLPNTPVEFNYTGNIQEYSAKIGVTYMLEVYGAQGGSYNNSASPAGKGGYSNGKYTPSKNETLYIGVGGAGTSSTASTGNFAGGYNGGGTGSVLIECLHGASGGGATHIGKTNNLLKDTSVSNLLIVAGGGGGAHVQTAKTAVVDYGTSYGGDGGGNTGGSSGRNSAESKNGIAGGTQTAGGTGSAQYGSAGSFGQGANATQYTSSGGGGGYYGGGSERYIGGSGGSGYIGGVSNGSTTNGQRSGNGYAKITIQSVVPI